MKTMFFNGEWEKLRSWEFGPYVLFYVVYFTIRGLFRNRGTVLTASLAFATALSIVPLLSVALWVLGLVGSLSDGSSLEPYIQQLFPAAASEIVAYLTEFARTSALEVAGVGALTFFVIAFFLFIAIERVFNIIWESHRKRPVAQKIGAFILLMALGPLALSLSFGLTSYAAIRFEQFNVEAGVLLTGGPFVIAFLFFTAMNHFLPTTRVHWGVSVLAGAFTASVFEVGKFGFNLYVTELILVPYNQVYGALGLFPLFLVWLYVIWIIVLLGTQLAYTAQNLRTIVRVERASTRSPGRAREHVFSPTIGLELYAPIAQAFKGGRGRLSDRDLVVRTGYNEVVVRSVVGELARIGALEIVEGEEGERRLLPAKQLEDVDLLPICEAFFDFDHFADSDADSNPIAELMRGYQSVTEDVLSGRSALSFVGPETNPLERTASRPGRPAPSPMAAPIVDADLFESPPSSSTEFGETLDASPVERVKALADRAKNLTTPDDPLRGAQASLKPMPVGAVDSTSASPIPMVQVDFSTDEPTSVDASGDGIRIHTQDILVEEEEVVTPAVGKPGSASLMLKKAMKSKRPKKKEPSIEIDIAGMWDDFEVDNYDDALAEASELGNEPSVPPPLPKGK